MIRVCCRISPLSAQHGDDVILKRMKRRHLARDILRFCDEARRRRPDVVFGADVIAGFPTESDQAHQASLDMIEAAGITHLHVSLFTALRNSGCCDAPAFARNHQSPSTCFASVGGQRLEEFLDLAVGSTISFWSRLAIVAMGEISLKFG